jgi:hypothetical protein
MRSLAIATPWLLAVAMAAALPGDALPWYGMANATRAAPTAPPPAHATVEAATRGQIRCTQPASCAYYDDVLLVVKLNPVRLLWLDLLLRFYGTGFRHIAFFSAQREDAADSWIPVGNFDTTVHLIDDNFGFCDHQTVARSMRWWPGYAGYIFLSDDVMFQFWRQVGWAKDEIWRQGAESKRITISTKELNAIADIHAAFPDLKPVLRASRPPFASTSGVYFMPNADAQWTQRFVAISGILMAHRTYNEWGTPILLHCLDRNVRRRIWRGKLRWGIKRMMLRGVLNPMYHWYHPVRANGELFARATEMVTRAGAPALTADAALDDSVFLGTCLDCATYPLAGRKMRALYHTCVAAEPSGEFGCAPADAAAAAATAKRTARKHWPAFVNPDRIGGNVVVRPERANTASALEVGFEGFWDLAIKNFVFDKYLPAFNTTRHRWRLLDACPGGCQVKPS